MNSSYCHIPVPLQRFAHLAKINEKKLTGTIINAILTAYNNFIVSIVELAFSH